MSTWTRNFGVSSLPTGMAPVEHLACSDGSPTRKRGDEGSIGKKLRASHRVHLARRHRPDRAGRILALCASLANQPFFGRAKRRRISVRDALLCGSGDDSQRGAMDFHRQASSFHRGYDARLGRFKASRTTGSVRGDCRSPLPVLPVSQQQPRRHALLVCRMASVARVLASLVGPERPNSVGDFLRRFTRQPSQVLRPSGRPAWHPSQGVQS